MESPYFSVRVPFRKALQLDSEGQLFEVHPQPELLAADMYTHVLWLRIEELFSLR
jgi:hypothetical protein